MAKKNETVTEAAPEVITEIALAAETKKPRGRKASSQEAAAPVDIPQNIVAEIKEEASLVQQAQDVVSTDQLMLAQQLGSMNAFSYLSRMSGLGVTKWLAQLKESKAYKGMQAINAKGEKVTLATFEDLCGVVGISRAKADADILNLAVLGEEFLDAAKGLGLGYREIRQIRQRPKEDRALMFEEDGKTIRTDDPEILKDWIEEILAKQSKVKKELEETQADLKARDRVLTHKNSALDHVQTQLSKLKNLEPDARMELMAEKEAKGREMMAEQGAEVLALFGKFLATAMGLQGMPGVSSAAAGMAHQGVSSLCESLAGLLTEYAYEIDFRGMVFPEWMEQAAVLNKRGDEGQEAENTN